MDNRRTDRPSYRFTWKIEIDMMSSPFNSVLRHLSFLAGETTSSTASSDAKQTVTINPIADSFAKAMPYSATEPKKLRIDRLIAEMLCADLQPFTTVEKTGFKRLIHGLDPRYAIYCYHYHHRVFLTFNIHHD